MDTKQCLLQKIRSLGFDIVYLDTCTSTNDLAATLIKENCFQNNTIILTNYQTHGKGLNRSTWQSQREKNITLSIIIYHKILDTPNLYYLNLVTSLAVSSSISAIIKDVKIKWPNDIYIQNKKISGILVESQIIKNTIPVSIIGIGVNVNQTTGLPTKATSLALLLNKNVSKEDLIAEILKNFNFFYNKFETRSLTFLRQIYTTNLYWHRERHCFRLLDTHKTFQGIILGIKEDGSLQILSETGNIFDFSIKQIEFLE